VFALNDQRAIHRRGISEVNAAIAAASEVFQPDAQLDLKEIANEAFEIEVRKSVEAVGHWILPLSRCVARSS
jgi:hypothetical protein